MSDGPRNCTTLVHVEHVLFAPADGRCTTQVFTVGDTPAIITGFEFSPGACASVEMVAGCGGGEYFTTVNKGCGCALALSEGNNQLIVSVPGRYRLSWCDCDQDEGYVELRFGAVTAQQVESSSMAGSCCKEAAVVPVLVSTTPCLTVASPTPAVTTVALDIACLCAALTPCIQALIPPSAAAHNPTSINGDPAVQVTGGGASQAFNVEFMEVEAASQMATNPAAVSILCAALTPCIRNLIPPPGASTLIVGDAPIVATPITGGYQISLAPDYLPHAPAVVTSSDGTLTVGISGADNQNFDLMVDCAALKAKCGFIQVSDAATLCIWASALPNVGPLQL